MASFGLVLDDRFKRHVTAAGHPERPQRLDAIRAALEWQGYLSQIALIEPTPIDLEVVHWLHDPAYVERLRRSCEHGRPTIDCPDSSICPESYEIARLAAGGVTEAARRIGRGELTRAFCAVRPPGHHCERDRSMGFCLLNNVALAAEVLRREAGLARILILDWDVHHGNGTQHLFEADPDVLFISLHGHPDTLYPGTGYAHERGVGRGAGATLNIPFMPGARDEDYQAAFETLVQPAVERFEPQVLLISAGYDAHADDPLGTLRLSDEAFDWMSLRALEWAGRFCGERVLSVLEGGYNLGVLRRCVAQHVHRLEGG